MTQQVGGSFGTAVLAIILEDAIVSHHAALAGAFHIAFWWSVGFSAVAVLLSLWLPGAQRPQPAEATPALSASRSLPGGTGGSGSGVAAVSWSGGTAGRVRAGSLRKRASNH